MLNSNSGGNNVSNPLDSLMMAYADLSGNSRGSSFKGPPLSQVVVTKQAAPAFTPSSKARDWSSLEQALEDAFVSSPNQKTQPNPSQGLWESSKIESTPNASSSGTLLDDWGDFQDFNSAENAAPIATPAFFLKGGSTASAVIADDDDFSDFVTAPAQQNAGAPISSNSVGSRLASFQEESPVHNFKWKKEPLPKLPDSPSRFDAFFGAEEDYTPTFPQTSLVQPIHLPTNSRIDEKICQQADPPIVLPLSGNNLGNVTITNIFTNSILDQLPLPASSLPQPSKSDLHLFGHLSSPPAPLADKYGALADLFSNPDPTNVSSLLSTANPIANQDAKEKSSLAEDLFSLPNPDVPTSPQRMENIEKEEDFGDFIAVIQDNPTFPLPAQDDFKAVNSQDHLAELSLNLSSHCQGQISSMPSIFPSSVNTRVIPWYESSPPPLPPDMDDEDNCDEFNTSGSLPLSSGNDDFLEEDSIFKTSLPTVDPLPVPLSNLDTLSVNTLDESTPSPDDEVLPQPLSEPEVEEPATMDIDAKIPKEVPHLFDQLTSPYREWSQAAYQILEIISNAADTFSNITDKDVLDEVIESQEGLNYLQNLVEVYRVFKRIQQSYSMAVWNPTVQSQCEDAEKAWKGLLVHLKLYIDVIPSRAVFDFSDCLVSSMGPEVTFCAICLLDLRHSSKETIGVVKESIITIDQKNYHSTCANFWVNCVNPSLPKLELTN